MKSKIIEKFLSVHVSLPTDIQAEGIPLILGGGDVLMVMCFCSCFVYLGLNIILMMCFGRICNLFTCKIA